MNNKFSLFLSKINLLATLAVLMLAIPLTAGAQATSGSVRGNVATPDGQPAAGATVNGDGHANQRHTYDHHQRRWSI